jgi:hypothetical protein
MNLYLFYIYVYYSFYAFAKIFCFFNNWQENLKKNKNIVLKTQMSYFSIPSFRRRFLSLQGIPECMARLRYRPDVRPGINR